MGIGYSQIPAETGVIAARQNKFVRRSTSMARGIPEGVFATATSPAHPTFLALAEARGLDSYDTSKGPER